MSVKFFGQYLIERHIINREQLLNATRYQYEKNLKFGEYARTYGWVDDKQLAQIQARQNQSGGRFGEIAVGLGFLSEAQVDEILQKQKEDYVYIGQALVQIEALSERQVQEYLAEFKREQQRFNQRLVELQLGAHEVVDEMEVVDLTKKLLWRHAGIEAKLYVAEDSQLEAGDSFHAASFEFHGHDHRCYGYACSKALVAKMAETVIGGQTDDSRELERSFNSLLSAIASEALIKTSRRNKRFDLTGPQALAIGELATRVREAANVRAFNFVSPAGQLALRIIS